MCVFPQRPPYVTQLLLLAPFSNPAHTSDATDGFWAHLVRDGREKHERVICRTEKRAEAVLGVLSCGEFQSAVGTHPSSRFDTADDGERLLDAAMGASPLCDFEPTSRAGGGMQHRSIRWPATLPHFQLCSSTLIHGEKDIRTCSEGILEV